jgi:hypothetical protein
VPGWRWQIPVLGKFFGARARPNARSDRYRRHLYRLRLHGGRAAAGVEAFLHAARPFAGGAGRTEGGLATARPLTCATAQPWEPTPCWSAPGRAWLCHHGRVRRYDRHRPPDARSTLRLVRADPGVPCAQRVALRRTGTGERRGRDSSRAFRRGTGGLVEKVRAAGAESVAISLLFGLPILERNGASRRH